MRGIGTPPRRLAMGAAVLLFANAVAAHAADREGALVAGVLVERMVEAVVTVHGDGRPPDLSDVVGFERRVDPAGGTLTEGPFPTEPGTADPLSSFGCAPRDSAPGYRDHTDPTGPARLAVDATGDRAQAVFHVYSLGGRTPEGRDALQVMICMAGGGRAGRGRRLLQAGVGAAYDETGRTHLLSKYWLAGPTPAKAQDGYVFAGSNAGAHGWVEQQPVGVLDGSLIGPFDSHFNDYAENAAATWWQDPCVEERPVCGPADGSTVFQGSLGGAVWEFSDDLLGDHRFRVALFFAVACSNPGACA